MRMCNLQRRVIKQDDYFSNIVISYQATESRYFYDVCTDYSIYL